MVVIYHRSWAHRYHGTWIDVSWVYRCQVSGADGYHEPLFVVFLLYDEKMMYGCLIS